MKIIGPLLENDGIVLKENTLLPLFFLSILRRMTFKLAILREVKKSLASTIREA